LLLKINDSEQLQIKAGSPSYSACNMITNMSRFCGQKIV